MAHPTSRRARAAQLSAALLIGGLALAGCRDDGLLADPDPTDSPAVSVTPSGSARMTAEDRQDHWREAVENALSRGREPVTVVAGEQAADQLELLGAISPVVMPDPEACEYTTFSDLGTRESLDAVVLGVHLDSTSPGERTTTMLAVVDFGDNDPAEEYITALTDYAQQCSETQVQIDERGSISARYIEYEEIQHHTDNAFALHLLDQATSPISPADDDATDAASTPAEDDEAEATEAMGEPAQEPEEAPASGEFPSSIQFLDAVEGSTIYVRDGSVVVMSLSAPPGTFASELNNVDMVLEYTPDED